MLQATSQGDLLSGLAAAASLSLASFAVIWFICKCVVYRQEKDYAAVEHIAMMYSNCGFIGIPMAQGIWGTDGVFYMTLTLRPLIFCYGPTG